MENYPFDTCNLGSDVVDQLNSAYNALKSKFTIEATGHIDFHLEDFELFKDYSGIRLLGSFVIRHVGKESYILFIEKHFRQMGSRTGVYEYYEYQA